MSRVTLRGLDRLLAQYQRGMRAAPHLAQAVFAEATVVLNESKKLVPVDTGALRASGMVEAPKISAAETSVTVSYGGAAAGYALYVHEDPNAAHAPGKTFKFLEIPAMAHADKFAKNVETRLNAYIRGGS
jgi:hypothetical protein